MNNNPLLSLGQQAKTASRELAVLKTSEKNSALLAIAEELAANEEVILKANAKDLSSAKNNGISTAMIDRLTLNSQRLKDIIDAVKEIVALPDPVGQVLSGSTRPNGLEIVKKAVPLGVVGIIYEARPNVTIDSAALCLKSGNTCILRGGSEAIRTNLAFANAIKKGLSKSGLPEHAVQLIEHTDREYSTALMQLNGYVDALIPRGGQGLIQAVIKNSSVPVIETGAGLCHLYVDESADFTMALSILDNAKTSRPSVCNAVETLLVHRDIASEFLTQVATLLKNRVELRGCDISLPYLGEDAVSATPEDWSTEYNDFILAIKTVDSVEDAIGHITAFSTKHSETIVTENYSTSEYFTKHVDAAAVYVNASSRFTDGGEFGLGAEIGISTQKLHVRGPMGLEALTSTTYIVHGSGQIR